MELLLTRDTFTPNTTIGKLAINGKFQCFVLEDVCRDINKDGDLNDLGEAKVFSKTAIPAGRYPVLLTYSNRFKKVMPLVANVPGFAGIRIHPGNTAADTEGCLLVGYTKAKDFVGESKAAYSVLFPLLSAASKKEKIFITIKRC